MKVRTADTVLAFVCAVALLVTAPASAALQWELAREGDLAAALYDPAYPTKRYGAVLAALEPNRSLTIAAGYAFDSEGLVAPLLDDVWQYDMLTGSYRAVPLAAVTPTPRHRAAYCAIEYGPHRVLLVFGGLDNDRKESDEVTLWDPTTERWAVVRVIGRGPSAHHGASMAAAGSRLVVFGGRRAGVVVDPEVFLGTLRRTSGSSGGSEEWVLEWFIVDQQSSSLSSSGSPQARHGSVLARSGEEEEGRFFLFGGYGSSQTNFNDLWELRVEWPSDSSGVGGKVTWHPVHPSSSASQALPAARGGAVGGVHRHYFYVALGSTCTVACTTLSDVWRFDLRDSTWSAAAIDNGPVGRHHSAYTLDGASLWVFGGESFTPYAYWNDLWRLSLLDDDEEDDGRLWRTSAVGWHRHDPAMDGTHSSLMTPLRPRGVRPTVRVTPREDPWHVVSVSFVFLLFIGWLRWSDRMNLGYRPHAKFRKH